MISEEELNECRATVQKILDKYLPEEKRFSVQNFSQEWLYELVSLILEKDEKEREKIRAQIEEKRNKIIERLKKEEYELHQEYIEIEKKKEEYDNIFNSINELNWLSESTIIDKELDEDLENIL